MIKFIDANVFIERWSNPHAKKLIDTLNRERHCTSVLVLSEVFHKLKKKKVENIFHYLRGVMGVINVMDITSNDFFNAMKCSTDLGINDKIHVEVMKRNGLSTIISNDADFDREKSISREGV